MRLGGTIAVVTGASRGAGRGIATALGVEGATVYVTGRSSRSTGSPTGRPETIEDTAELVTAAGGHGVPVYCDHTDAAQTRQLFDRVRAEQGRLDVLVSNAWGGYEKDVLVVPAWSLDPAHLDLMLAAGLRAHLLTAQYGGALLAETGNGLLVCTTWAVGADYHEHLYYDVVKTAINRIPVGMAAELAASGGTALAVSPGWMLTEAMADGVSAEEAAQTESPTFVGRAIAALAADGDVRRHSGSLRTVVELAAEYGCTDVNGRSSSLFWDELARGNDVGKQAAERMGVVD